MKNCTPRNHLSQLVLTVIVAAAQHGFAQTAPSQGTTPGDPSAPAATSPSSAPATALPDAPGFQNQAKDAPQQDQTHINPIPLLSPKLNTGTMLTAHDKWEIYLHKTYSPAAAIYPLVGAGIRMANPKKNYPREWQDGMGAFGRNYGSSIAQRAARNTADFGTQVLFHEDPRYQRSDSKNPALRIGHALAWTLVDKSDSGHRMLAVSTFTSAAAGGFVGMAYLPDGYNDVTHAEQRMASGIEGRAISNIVNEFEPLWAPLAKKVHIPKLLPSGWGSKPKQ